MKNIVLDTDVGIDCDDAIAIAELIGLEKRGECKLVAITLSTTREGAAASVRSIFAHYGKECPRIGKYSGAPLSADAKNCYAKKLYERFGNDDGAELAITVLKQTLANIEGKAVLVVIGPQSNLAELLRLDGGKELIHDKVEKICIMGGCFNGLIKDEFNIAQDVLAAKYVAAHCPVEIIYVPFEEGDDVLTGGNIADHENHPVGVSIKVFFDYEFPGSTFEQMERSSWDPITALVAVRGAERYFKLSDKGTADFSESMHKFVVGDGMARYVMCGDKTKLKKEINELIGDY